MQLSFKYLKTKHMYLVVVNPWCNKHITQGDETRAGTHVEILNMWSNSELGILCFIVQNILEKKNIYR